MENNMNQPLIHDTNDYVIPTIKYGPHTSYDKNGQEINCIVEERAGMGPLITFEHGGVIDIVPPIPTDPEWWKRVIDNCSKTAYEENARILRERQGTV